MTDTVLTPAQLDRLLHHAHDLDQSESKRKAGLLEPKNAPAEKLGVGQK